VPPPPGWRLARRKGAVSRWICWPVSTSVSFDLLRRQAEQRATQEDLSLAEQIRARVAVRVQTGEAPRYELIKADTELLNAQKSAESAILRVAQARAALRGLVGSVPASRV
jgi:cobalt-zinc-cadmium efflux system outer membrane protein